MNPPLKKFIKLIPIREFMKLHNKLRGYFENQKKECKSFIYAIEGSYQGYDKDNRVLEIGCNCGFTTLYAGEMVRHADGIEINLFLVKIGEDSPMDVGGSEKYEK